MRCIVLLVATLMAVLGSAGSSQAEIATLLDNFNVPPASEQAVSGGSASRVIGVGIVGFDREMTSNALSSASVTGGALTVTNDPGGLVRLVYDGVADTFGTPALPGLVDAIFSPVLDVFNSGGRYLGLHASSWSPSMIATVNFFNTAQTPSVISTAVLTSSKPVVDLSNLAGSSGLSTVGRVEVTFSGTGTSSFRSFDVSVVPEPATLVGWAGAGLVLLLFVRRKRKRRSAAPGHVSA